MKETPQQKYQRLLHEVQELTSEVEKIKVTSSSSPSITEEGLPAGRERLSVLLDKGAEFSEFRKIQESTFSAISG